MNAPKFTLQIQWSLVRQRYVPMLHVEGPDGERSLDPEALECERDQLRADVERLTAELAESNRKHEIRLRIFEEVCSERNRLRAEVLELKEALGSKPAPALAFRDANGIYHEFHAPTEIKILVH